uniref:Uncharacterized protein n=1 Tax=Quercus lobata TaxID=97700 RepID=A0A7N2RBW7_QUELO
MVGVEAYLSIRRHASETGLSFFEDDDETENGEKLFLALLKVLCLPCSVSVRSYWKHELFILIFQKLGLAPEKNLLVTSMLTKSIDKYPQSTVQKPDEPEKAGEELEAHPNSVQMGSNLW